MNDQRNLLLVLELEPEATPEEAERLGRQLRAELAQLDVDTVRPAAVSDEPGSKGAGVDWGSLLVAMSAAGGVFTSVIALAQDWLSRHGSARRIKMTIDDDSIVLERATPAEREQLIQAWIDRHSGA